MLGKRIIAIKDVEWNETFSLEYYIVSDIEYKLKIL